jgi:hypothetical protein
MIHAAAEARERCFNHTHRRATRKCFRCMRGMCDECAREWSGQPACDPCIVELEELERITHIPPRERVRRFGLSLRNFLIGVAILAILAVPASFVVRRLMSTPITPEEFARFRYAASGTFETEEGTNVLSTVLGARVVVASSDLPEYPARRLNDEFVGPAYTGWRSDGAVFPQEVVFDVGQPTRPEKINVQQQPGEPPETGVKDFEVEGSLESPNGPWQPLGRYTAQPIPELQRFLIERPLPARFIRLKVLSNYGGPYASLGEFDAFILPRSPFAQPSVTP